MERNNSALTHKIQYNTVIKIKSSRNIWQCGESTQEVIGSGGRGEKTIFYSMNQFS